MTQTKVEKINVTGTIYSVRLFGAGGLNSGEGFIEVDDAATGMRVRVRLGGPGTNEAGEVSAAQFEWRALRLITSYCRTIPVRITATEFGNSLPDITSVDGT